MKKEDIKILIVDDTPENIDVLSGLLREYDLMAAINGEIALQIVEEAKPDLILLDIMMPGIDGYEVASRLKKDPLTKDIPIIFITAKTDTDSIVKGFDLGASDYISKPIEPKEVLARVEKEIKIYRLTSELKDLNKTLEQKVAERTVELRISEEKYRNIVNTSLVGIFTTDIEGNIYFVNEAFSLIIGYNNSAEIIDHNCWSFFNNEIDKENILGELNKINKISKYETVLKAKDESIIIVLLYAVKREDQITVMVVDASEKSFLETQLLRKGN